MKKSQALWPKTITVGNGRAVIYRLRHRRAKNGVVFAVTWKHPGAGRKTRQFTQEKKAHEAAREAAEAINAGKIRVAGMTEEDCIELEMARKTAHPVPLLAAIQEWRRLQELTGNRALKAAEEFARRASITPKPVENAIKEFINFKNSEGKAGTETYKSKLGHLARKFPGRDVDGITTAELDGMLEKINDPVTRNGVRKRCVTLFRWCKKQKWLPEADIPAIEKTIIVRETAKRIGIISSEVFEKCLRHIRASQPEDLAALVFAGFCGLRGDEIHGKRHQGQKIRQVWEDIHIGQKILNVTNVKQNTPSWRLVPICDAAVAWLKLCPDFIKTQKAAGPAQNTGQPGTPVCGPNAMQSIRRSCALAKISLPRNCFRHSFISHRIAQLNGNKNQTADEAGNSVRQITKHYRVPLPKEQGDTWFNLFP